MAYKNINLKKITINYKLRPGYVSNKNLVHLLIENMEANFYKRPVNDGFK